jgi:hypothetical protein
MILHPPQARTQSGAALAISLLLLLILTLVAITSMEGSNLGFKMSVNMISHEEAFNNSESARLGALDVMPDYIDQADWNRVTLPAGLALSSAAELMLDNDASENPLDTTSLDQDFRYARDGMHGDVFVLKGQTVQNTYGAGSAQYKGYGGAGVGVGGAGGAFKYFELRSKGERQKSDGTVVAESWTGSDYRYVF